MLGLTAHAIHEARRTAVQDVLNAAGAKFGLPPLFWCDHDAGPGPHLYSGYADTVEEAARWAEQLGLMARDQPVAGTREWRGQVSSGDDAEVSIVVVINYDDLKTAAGLRS